MDRRKIVKLSTYRNYLLETTQTNTNGAIRSI